MLFKFASFLLGTNNEEETKPEEQQFNIESSEQQQDTQPCTNENSTLNKDENLLNDEKNLTNENKQEDLIEEDDYMYAEQLINCSKLKNSDFNLESNEFNKEDQLCDQLEEDEDCEDDQWIYITPIKRKNEEEKEITEEEFVSEQEEEQDENCILVDGDQKNTSNANVPKQPQEEVEKEQFNFYDYFNNKSSLTNNLTTLNEENDEHCSPVKQSKISNTKKKLVNSKLHSVNRGIEESWIEYPPACFQLDNTFTIEEHPLENLYIENPALSVMASCKSIDKENSSTSSLTNSSLNATKSNRVLVDRNLNQASAGGRKSMRKRANSTRKTNKTKTNSKKSKNQTKKTDLPESSANQAETTKQQQNVATTLQVVEQPAKEVNGEEGDEQKLQVLHDRQEKQLLVHYLTMNPNQLQNTTITPTTSNTIATIATTSSSNGSILQSTNHSHNHTHLHYISNNCVTNNNFNANTNANASVEHKKGSKSLRRNNKVALKRDNLANKPFTLHRKLC